MSMACLLVAGTMAAGFGAGTATAAPAPGSAQENVCKGIGLTASNGKCGDNGDQVRSAIAAAINILSLAVGIAAVVMIIVAGLKFITAGGEASKIASAKGSIIYAVIGVIVVALAQFIVRFVLTQVKQ
jgi:hypothetical protein